MMRRTIALVVAAVALTALVAVPAGAAPKNMFTWNVTCPGESYTVASKGIPGWGDSVIPELLLGGTYIITEGSESSTWTVPAPAGLEGRLKDCRVWGPIEPAPFQLVVYPAYVLTPGG